MFKFSFLAVFEYYCSIVPEASKYLVSIRQELDVKVHLLWALFVTCGFV